MSVEHGREVFDAAQVSLFAVTEQLQMPHTTVCETEGVLAVSSGLFISVCGFCL
jgi:hypothetical protein